MFPVWKDRILGLWIRVLRVGFRGCGGLTGLLQSREHEDVLVPKMCRLSSMFPV